MKSDAALDESNLQLRFTDTLEDFSGQTQFALLLRHRQTTMEAGGYTLRA